MLGSCCPLGLCISCILKDMHFVTFKTLKSLYWWNGGGWGLVLDRETFEAGQTMWFILTVNWRGLYSVDKCVFRGHHVLTAWPHSMVTEAPCAVLRNWLALMQVCKQDTFVYRVYCSGKRPTWGLYLSQISGDTLSTWLSYHHIRPWIFSAFASYMNTLRVSGCLETCRL